MKVYNLIGMKFDRLTVVERMGSVQQKKLWRCECECGGIVDVTTDRLRSGHTKSCGCLSREIIGNIRRKDDGVASFNALYRKYINGAKRRGYDFDLSKDEFKELTSDNCYYCGSVPLSGNYGYVYRNGDYIYNGIDRVNNEEGYVLNNCVSCCTVCNKMKHMLTKEYFLNHISKILEHQRSIKS